MTIQLNETLQTLLAPGASVKVLAASSEDGTPHVAFDDSIHLDADGRIVFLELVEHSRTNRSLLRSLWFNRSVSLGLLAPDGRSFQIRGKPYRAIISGPVFEAYYRQVTAGREDTDLSTVWLIEPESWTEETYAVRRETEEKGRLPLIHLDRIAKFPSAKAA